MKNRVYLVSWSFAVNEEHFRVDFYSDNSADFYSWKDRNNQLIGDPNIFLKAIAGSESARQQITNHSDEFTIMATSIDPVLISEIIRLDEKLDRNEDISTEEEENIDYRLAPYFWEQINPFLLNPHKK